MYIIMNSIFAIKMCKDVHTLLWYRKGIMLLCGFAMFYLADVRYISSCTYNADMELMLDVDVVISPSMVLHKKIRMNSLLRNVMIRPLYCSILLAQGSV